jgi:hypothetical protein
MIITNNGRRSSVILGILTAGLAAITIIEAAVAAPSSLLRGVAPQDGIAAIEDQQQRDIVDRRHLQVCSSYSKAIDCKNAGCEWNGGGGCGTASTPPPSPQPVSSAEQ